MSEKQLTVMDVLKVLNRSNCRECGLPTCMAFAVMVAQGQKELSECPYVDGEIKERMKGAVVQNKQSLKERRDELLYRLKQDVASVDFTKIADKIGAEVNNGRLVIRCLGRIFELDQFGELHSLSHVNSWVHLPIINYVVHSAGRDLNGEWVPFSELKHAADWVRFFEKRCVEVMRDLADDQPELFLNIVGLFSSKELGDQADASESADHVFTLFPLPKVPMKISVWEADGQFESNLTLLFDRSAEVNLGVEALYMLCVGFLKMLKRISQTHSA